MKEIMINMIGIILASFFILESTYAANVQVSNIPAANAICNLDEANITRLAIPNDYNVKKIVVRLPDNSFPQFPLEKEIRNFTHNEKETRSFTHNMYHLFIPRVDKGITIYALILLDNQNEEVNLRFFLRNVNGNLSSVTIDYDPITKKLMHTEGEHISLRTIPEIQGLDCKKVLNFFTNQAYQAYLQELFKFSKENENNLPIKDLKHIKSISFNKDNSEISLVTQNGNTLVFNHKDALYPTLDKIRVLYFPSTTVELDLVSPPKNNADLSQLTRKIKQELNNLKPATTPAKKTLLSQQNLDYLFQVNLTSDELREFVYLFSRLERCDRDKDKFIFYFNPSNPAHKGNFDETTDIDDLKKVINYPDNHIYAQVSQYTLDPVVRGLIGLCENIEKTAAQAIDKKRSLIKQYNLQECEFRKQSNPRKRKFDEINNN